MENQISPTQENLSDVYKVAKFQKYLLAIVLVNLFTTIFLRNPAVSIVISIVSMYFIYQIGTGLKMKYIWLWLVILLLPFVSLILILIINNKATTFIRRNGFKVGLLGANVNEIKSKIV